jgi:hypothetical protein
VALRRALWPAAVQPRAAASPAAPELEDAAQQEPRSAPTLQDAVRLELLPAAALEDAARQARRPALARLHAVRLVLLPAPALEDAARQAQQPASARRQEQASSARSDVRPAAS